MQRFIIIRCMYWWHDKASARLADPAKSKCYFSLCKRESKKKKSVESFAATDCFESLLAKNENNSLFSVRMY